MDEKQQQLLEHFFEITKNKKQFLSLPLAVPMVWLLLSIIWFMFPVQSFELKKNPMIILFYGFQLKGIELLTHRYLFYKEDRKNRCVSEVLKGLPVSEKQLFIFRFRKLFNIVWKYSAVALAMQSAGVLISSYSLSWLNFVYILGSTFLLPILFFSLQFIVRK